MFYTVFLKILISIYFIILDPFGLHTNTQKVSENLVFRALALSHPSEASKHIGIILIDDKSARRLNGAYGYPITFEQHADVLRPVMCAGPASLFINLNIKSLRVSPDDKHSGKKEYFQALINTLKVRASAGDEYCPLLRYKERSSFANTRVYQARVVSQHDHICDPFFHSKPPVQCHAAKALEDLRSYVQPVTISPIEDDGAYMLATPYPKSIIAKDRTNKNSEMLEASPALAMVIAFCQNAPVQVKKKLKGCQDLPKLQQLLREKDTQKLALIPRWPFYRTAAMEDDEKDVPRSKKELVCPAYQSYSQRNNNTQLHVKNILDAFFHGVLKGVSPFSSNSLCIPYDHIFVDDLRRLISRVGEDSSGKVGEIRTARYLSGKMIFYGTKITASNDLVYSPVLGYVPNVSVHATAADNLLNYGIDYLHRPARIHVYGNFYITLAQVIEIFLATIFIILFGLLAFNVWVRMGIIFIIATLISITSFLVLNFPPSNFIGIFLLCTAISPFQKRVFQEK